MLEKYTPDQVGYGDQVQEPEVIARSAVLLMADGKRHGQNIYSRQGKHWEMEDPFMKVARSTGGLDEDVVSLSLRLPKQSFMIVDLAKHPYSGPESNPKSYCRGGDLEKPQHGRRRASQDGKTGPGHCVS